MVDKKRKKYEPIKDSVEKSENKTKFIIDALDKGWSVKKMLESDNCYEFKIDTESIVNKDSLKLEKWSGPDVARSLSEPISKLITKKDTNNFINRVFR